MLLTRREVAERLRVTQQALSKWRIQEGRGGVASHRVV